MCTECVFRWNVAVKCFSCLIFTSDRLNWVKKWNNKYLLDTNPKMTDVKELFMSLNLTAVKFFFSNRKQFELKTFNYSAMKSKKPFKID